MVSSDVPGIFPVDCTYLMSEVIRTGDKYPFLDHVPYGANLRQLFFT